jgi:hypothetical protein
MASDLRLADVARVVAPPASASNSFGFQAGGSHNDRLARDSSPQYPTRRKLIVVTIELVELVQPPGIPRWRWQPFEVSPNYMREDWWHRLPNVDSHEYPLYSARIDGTEVARVQLEKTLNFEHYRRAGLYHAGALGIARIEVDSTLRTYGIGKAVVAAIATKFPYARLVAFSADADGFWGDSLQWQRFDPDNGPGQGPMFVAPVGWTGVRP